MQVLELQLGESNSGRFFILLFRTILPALRSPTLKPRISSGFPEVLRWLVLPHIFVLSSMGTEQ
jgi:hypothetical protein